MARILIFIVVLGFLATSPAFAAEPAKLPPARVADGYRGIWYMNQPQNDAYRYKYSGGFGTYPQQHIPMAVYAKAANKTFFCFGGKSGDANRITDMVGCYDHATGLVSRPVAVLERQTNDTHYNPTIALDEAGYVYLFCNCHGTGYESSKEDPVHGRALIFRSAKPYSIDAFELVRDDNFSYSQPWCVEGRGLLWLHTRYDRNQRRLFWSTSADGAEWAQPRQLTNIERGSYQISWSDGQRVATAIDFHPAAGGLNARTNIYYLETRDFGRTWTNAAGEAVKTPLVEPANPALIHDFQEEKLLVYLKDLAFDAAGHPIILYLTSRGYKSGPASGPRLWHTARWTGDEWVFRPIVPSDHNYDHGSLYIEPDGAWRLIAPTGEGPQPHGTGGRIVVHISRDEGQTWEKTGTFPIDTARNQTYVRRPYRAHDGFYAYWADGDALAPSESDLYFATKSGEVYRLPRHMDRDWARPQRVVNDTTE